MGYSLPKVSVNFFYSIKRHEGKVLKGNKDTRPKKLLEAY